jgi:transposase InsO family protein
MIIGQFTASSRSAGFCQFRAPAPNILWVSDFTYVSTWQEFTYVAFIINTFANRIVGWKASRSAKTDIVLAESFKWVDWFNHRRLLEPIGNIPPAEAEENDNAKMENTKMAA